MSMHLIKIQAFTHASRVTKFSVHEVRTYSTDGNSHIPRISRDPRDS